VKPLEVAADRDALGELGAVVELEDGDAAIGIARQELGGAVLGLPEVDLHGRNVDGLLGEEDADAARVRRHRAVVELHAGPSSGRPQRSAL
jgi:hypothetical protein